MSSQLVQVVEREALPAAPLLSGSLYGLFLKQLDASQKTKETYTRNLKQFFVWLNEQGITQPTRDDVVEYRDALRLEKKPTTVQNYMAVVRIFFTWTENAKIYPNVARGVKGAKLDRAHKKDHLTKRQVKAIATNIERDSLTGARDYAIFALMVSCGLRTIEVVRANIEDLRPLGDQTVLYVQGKGHEEKAQVVIIPPAVEAAIRAYLAKRGRVSETAPLFGSTSNNNKDGRLTTRSVSGIAKSLMKEAGFNSDRLTAHSLRHTAVTVALQEGQSLDAVQAFARHTNINTTMIYNHALDAANNKCSSLVSKCFFD